MKTSVLLAILIAVSSVAASIDISVVSHNTDVQSTYTELKACSCGSATDSFTVKNLGMLYAGYSFSVQADQPWFWIDKTTAYLAPGESTDFSVYTKAGCGVTGTGHYTVYVSSEYGRYRAIDKSIDVGVCENIKESISPQQATVQPCSSQQFNLTLTNVATFRERYTVEGLGFPSATLDPAETVNLVGNYTASCSEWGTKQLPVTIKAENNNMQTEDHVTVNVPRAYDYDLKLGDVQKPVCQGVASDIPVIIANTEDRDNTFSIQGEPWTSSASVYVPAQRTRVTTLSFTPEDAGNKEVSVTVTGANGSIEKKTGVTIPVEACYGFTMQAAQQVESCPGALYLPYTIKSEGDQNQQLSFDVQSNATTSIDSLSDQLSPGQQFDKTVQVQLPDTDQTYYVTLVANSTYANKAATTTVKGYSTESCYNVAPENTNFRVWTDQTVLPIIVKQSGLQPATYNVQYAGRFIRPLEQNITISPQGEAVLHLLVNSTGFSTGRYLDRLTLTTAGVHYTSDLEINLGQKGFWQNFLDACRWNGSFGVCSVTSSVSLFVLLIVVILVVGILVGLVHYENPSWFSKETAAIIGAAILILLLVVMIMAAPSIPRSYERPVMPANESSLYYEVGAGQTLSINVNKFFYSPDNNNLTFTSSQPKHLQVRLQNGVALVKADESYSGEDTLVFTANDGHGGITDSDLFRINVVPFKPVTFLQYWQYSCWFLTALFLFIAFALALLTTLFIKDVKPVHEHKRALILYRRPKVHVMHGQAHDLLQQASTSIQNLPPGTTIGQIVGTQINVQQEQLYVASAEGIKFHHIKCPFVKAMPKDKRLTFTSKEDAIKAGYTPCKTCSSHA